MHDSPMPRPDKKSFMDHEITSSLADDKVKYCRFLMELSPALLYFQNFGRVYVQGGAHP